MAVMHRFRSFAAAATAVLAVVVVAITLVGTNSPGPTVNFRAAGVYFGGVPANPGESADFSATLLSSSSANITLLGISEVPLPGFATPRLVHVALLESSRHYPSGTTGWPPRSGAGAQVYPTRPAIGARIRIGKGQLPIVVYGVTGSKSGRLYAVAGVKVRFSVNGAVHTALVLAGGFDCVQKFSDVATHSETSWCFHQYSRADLQQSKIPAAKSILSR
jgi:hypothetical protein